MFVIPDDVGGQFKPACRLTNGRSDAIPGDSGIGLHDFDQSTVCVLDLGLLLVRDTIGPVVDSDDTVLFAGIHCPLDRFPSQGSRPDHGTRVFLVLRILAFTNEHNGRVRDELSCRIDSRFAEFPVCQNESAGIHCHVVRLVSVTENFAIRIPINGEHEGIAGTSNFTNGCCLNSQINRKHFEHNVVNELVLISEEGGDELSPVLSPAHANHILMI